MAFPIAAAVLPAIAGVIGSIVSYKGQQDTNDRQIDFANQNNAWQAYLANTAYQRQFNDMKLAGLNPILAFGNGAPVPSASQAALGNPGADAGKNLGGVVNSAIDAARLQAQMEQMDKQNELIEQQTLESKTNQMKTQADTFKAMKETEGQAVQNEIMKKENKIYYLKEGVDAGSKIFNMLPRGRGGSMIPQVAPPPAIKKVPKVGPSAKDYNF